MSEKYLAQFGARLAKAINDEISTFKGHKLRADAGEPGMIYVALRGAKKETALGQSLADKVGQIADRLIADEDQPIDCAISMGRGNRDLLLQIECRLGQ